MKRMNETWEKPVLMIESYELTQTGICACKTNIPGGIIVVPGSTVGYELKCQQNGSGHWDGTGTITDSNNNGRIDKAEWEAGIAGYVARNDKVTGNGHRNHDLTLTIGDTVIQLPDEVDNVISS